MILCIQESAQAGGRQKKDIILHSRCTSFKEIHVLFLKTRNIFIWQNQESDFSCKHHQAFEKKNEWIICLKANCIQDL